MRAAVLEAPGCMRLAEVDAPTCPEGGLLVEIRACSICSTDVKMYQRGHRDLVYPRILGHEVSGVVVESRAPNDQIRVGERVQVYPGMGCRRCLACRRGTENMCPQVAIFGFNRDGGFAQLLAVPPQGLASINPIPEGLSFEEAALAEPLASCLNGQQLADVTGGDSVLVIGAGPLGLLHTMLARTNRASPVLLAERLPPRLTSAGPAGADRLIDTSRESLEAAVWQETDGRGVDVILVAGSEFDVAPLPHLLVPGGRLCLFSGLPSDSSQTVVDTNLVHYRQLAIVGAYGSTAAQNRAAIKLISAGKVPVAWLITRRLSLDEIEGGMDYTARRQGLRAVITFPGERRQPVS